MNGPKIRALRVEKGLTRAQLAAKIGCHLATAGAAERSNRIYDVIAGRMARALGVKLEDITENGESEPETDRLSA